MEMHPCFKDHKWNATPITRHAWINAISKQGWNCKFDASRRGPSTIDMAQAGQTGIVNIDVAWQSVSPVLHRISAPWNGDRLIVKVVKSGTLRIEQSGQTATFKPGDVVVLDPQHMFNEFVCEPVRMSALCVPKDALRERGLRHRFPLAFRPDPASADVGAVREFVLNLTSQAGKASDPLLARLAEQCLDLMDVLVSDRGTRASERASVATVLRAKQVIARHIGDRRLSPARIAAELNMSTSSLLRALKAKGLSPMRYAWSLRLEHAARLLGGAPHGAIQEVAYQCGFESTSHFSRAFKERYGMTPREYAASQHAAAVDALEGRTSRARS
ncbi:AraC family transcriptional regulator [Paraburkholderia rhizosphaerae]|uniref:AraC-like DNA-binding protein n=1 Tax=Paraburkholderia rhizosphaerae TaxID=480658 RepID=A0A4V3HE37_9BURK|nr:AraC family transcriptional regulator [Paraburkholderia rhizosphaerae]TDY43275.1 AraC-like DNA-binding protein [Paraburkholderia rhizosphaerae]